jgi:hypothetical protein
MIIFMKKQIVVLAALCLLTFAFSGISQAWQGRMDGMGDPYGLIPDESDFLIHPSKIVDGEGVRFYGDYRYTYVDVFDWDHGLDAFTPAFGLIESVYRETSGDEHNHEALLGTAFPLGAGRMGLFFQYSGKRREYDGDQTDFYPPATYWYDYYDLQSELDDFSFRLLYGLPAGDFRLGGEVQFAYRRDENRIQYAEILPGGGYDFWTNFPWGSIIGDYYFDFFPFMLPYDSQYWETLLKGSLGSDMGPLDWEFTLRGGFLFGGDNDYVFEYQSPVGTPIDRFELDGDVEGWGIGGDLWVRYPLAEDLCLPFLVRADYHEKTRDGNGPGLLGLTGFNYDYENRERNFHVEAGGGVDKVLDNGTRIAGGIYYNYIQGKNDLWVMEWLGAGIWWNYDHSDFPESTEHQAMVRLSGEREFTPEAAMRMGLGLFYGWVEEDFVFTYSDFLPIGYSDDISVDGSHWGIGASLGGTFKFQRFTLEPFLNAGYQELDLDGDGVSTWVNGVILNRFDMEMERCEWYVGAGFSALLDLL